jgi:hypothetical protein
LVSSMQNHVWRIHTPTAAQLLMPPAEPLGINRGASIPACTAHPRLQLWPRAAAVQIAGTCCTSAHRAICCAEPGIAKGPLAVHIQLVAIPRPLEPRAPRSTLQPATLAATAATPSNCCFHCHSGDRTLLGFQQQVAAEPRATSLQTTRQGNGGNKDAEVRHCLPDATPHKHNTSVTGATGSRVAGMAQTAQLLMHTGGSSGHVIPHRLAHWGQHPHFGVLQCRSKPLAWPITSLCYAPICCTGTACCTPCNRQGYQPQLSASNRKNPGGSEVHRNPGQTKHSLQSCTATAHYRYTTLVPSYC